MNEPNSDVEELLREEFRQPSMPSLVTADDMLRRVARSRRRTNAVLASVLALLAVTIGAAVVLNRPAATAPPLPALPAPSSDAGPSAPPAPSAFPSPTHLALTRYPQVQFTDAAHGSAVLADCPPGSATCQVWLGATGDGGRTWQTSPVRGLEFPITERDTWMAYIRTIDTSRIVLDVGADGGLRWFTADGGRTWTNPSTAVAGAVPAIPDGAQPYSRTNENAPVDIVVLLPDGTSALLSGTPKVKLTHSRVARGADGSIWLHGGDDVRSFIFASHDGGRTWSEVPLPAACTVADRPGMCPGSFWTADGQTLYVTDFSDSRIWRSTDDGRHWRKMTFSGNSGQGGTMISLFPPDGGLLLYVATGANPVIYRLAPGDDRLRVVDSTADESITSAGVRFLRTSAGGPPYATSADGVTWTGLRF